MGIAMLRLGAVLLLCLGVTLALEVVSPEEKARAAFLAGALQGKNADQLENNEQNSIDGGEGKYEYDDGYEYYEEDGVQGKQADLTGDEPMESFMQDLINAQAKRNNKVGAELGAMNEPPVNGINDQGPSGASGLGAWAGLGSYGFSDVRKLASPNFGQFYGPLSVQDTNPASVNLDQIDSCPRTAENGVKYYCLKLDNGFYHDPWNPWCGYITCSSGVATRMACAKGTWMGVMQPVTLSQTDLCRKPMEAGQIKDGQCPRTSDYPLCASAENADGIQTYAGAKK